MEIEVIIGIRAYIFYNRPDVEKAEALYQNFNGAQEDFETIMDSDGLDYCYSLIGEYRGGA